MPGTESLSGVGSEFTVSMELDDGESNKKRKIEEAKEAERLSPFRSTEEEKDSTTSSSFDTAVQGDKTAVIDKGAAVIDNKEGVVLEEEDLGTEDDVKLLLIVTDRLIRVIHISSRGIF